MTRAIVYVFAWVPVIFTSAGAAADEGASIQVVGHSVKMVTPNVVRVRCRVFSEGSTAESAMTKLTASRELLQTKLAAKGSNDRTHAFGPVVELEQSKGSLQEIQMKAMQNMMGGGAKEEEGEKFVRLSFTITLEWKLIGEETAAHVRKIDAAKLELESLGLHEADESNSHVEEEDSEDDDPQDTEAGVASAGAKVRLVEAPNFSYVRTLTDNEIAEMAAEAFQDARRGAEQLAKAAGGRLGKLKHLSRSTAHETSEAANQFEQMAEMFGPSRPKFDEDELAGDSVIASDTFKPIAHRFDVSAVFAIE